MVDKGSRWRRSKPIRNGYELQPDWDAIESALNPVCGRTNTARSRFFKLDVSLYHRIRNGERPIPESMIAKLLVTFPATPFEDFFRAVKRAVVESNETDEDSERGAA